MTGRRPPLVEDPRDPGPQDLPRGEECGRVEVALQREAGAHPARGLVERHPEVHADHVGARTGQEREELARADPEVDPGDAEGGERFQHRRGRRAHRCGVVACAERPDPRVEELDGRRARRDLDLQERPGDLREPVQEVPPQHRVAQHQRLRPQQVPAGAALDEVAGQRERRPGEADERRGTELRDEQPHRLGDVGDVLRRERAEPIEVGAGADRLGDHRPHPGDDVQVDPRGGERDDDVGVEDRGVHPVAAYRLQRDLGDEIGAPAGLEHADPLADLAVLREGAAGLAHEPHRRTFHREPTAGSQEVRRLQTRVSRHGYRSFHA